jgi:signal peptidase I
MGLSNQKSEKLHAEARELYDRYGILKSKIRVDRSRVDLQVELDTVEDRYRLIVNELRDADASIQEENAHIRTFDVGHYRAHKPVATDISEGDGYMDKAFSLLKPRTLISLFLLLFFGFTLCLMQDKTIGFFVVPSSSMEPTLIPDDKLVTFRKTDYRRGDVIVLQDPVEKGAYLVKRIVAMGNDDIYVHDGTILVNGKPVNEPYIRETIDYDFEPYHIPDGHVFVLGDNRNNSDDGHKWGHGVPMATIIGEVKYIYLPRTRSKSISSGYEQFSAAGL